MSNDTWQKLIADIRSYESFPRNWDTYHGKPASRQAVEFAVGLLEACAETSLPLPRVAPISSGVYLFWPGCEFEVDDESVLYVTTGREDSTYDVGLALRAVCTASPTS